MRGLLNLVFLLAVAFASGFALGDYHGFTDALQMESLVTDSITTIDASQLGGDQP